MGGQLRRGGTVAGRPVGDLGQILAGGCRPWRHFGWRTGERHRPGLQFPVSTGRHHGFESLEEQRFLVALDFAGVATDVMSQPFRLRAETPTGQWDHVPDFLAVTGDGAWLVDVRPRPLVKDEDLVLFAAAAEAALAAGWRYAVICGWRRHAMAALEMLSSQRRPLADPLRLAPQLLAPARAGPLGFDDLNRATSCPAVARAHALHPIWHRRLGIDVAGPLTGQAMVWLGDMATRDQLIRQYVAERCGPEAVVQSYWTLWRTWGECFGPGGSRQRYARSRPGTPPDTLQSTLRPGISEPGQRRTPKSSNESSATGVSVALKKFPANISLSCDNEGFADSR